MHIEVVYSAGPRSTDETTLDLPEGATVLDALRASGLLQRHPSIDLEHCKVGVWGRVRPLRTALNECDRVEVYRPLRLDPKEARRQRAAATCSPKR